VFCAIQEFLQNSTHSANAHGPKTKSQVSRNRRRSSRPRTSRRSRASVKSKKSRNVTPEPQFVAVTQSFGEFSSKSEPNSLAHQAAISRPTVPCHVLGTSAGHGRTLTYAERMQNYIAQAIIADNENDQSLSPPTLSHVYSNSPVMTSSEACYSSKYDTRPENVCKMHCGSIPSIRRTVPCTEELTPCKVDVEIYDDSPAAKRRLFHDASFIAPEANSDGRSSSLETVVGQIGHQNGYHTLQKFLTSSLNGKTLGPVDHYEDGLLAIANAACLMSTGVSDGIRTQTTVSEGQGWWHLVSAKTV